MGQLGSLSGPYLPSSERMIWLDIETFGLDPVSDPIIEIGFLVTNLDLEIVGAFHEVIWSPNHETRYVQLKADSEAEFASKSDKFIYQMHTDSGLFDYARKDGHRIGTVKNLLNSWTAKYKITTRTDPLCGSSIAFDRGMMNAQLKGVLDGFSYRNIDISSLKEVCMRYNPEMFAHLKSDTNPKGVHRVMPDLKDSIEEFRWYRDNFLWIGAVE